MIRVAVSPAHLVQERFVKPAFMEAGQKVQQHAEATTSNEAALTSKTESTVELLAHSPRQEPQVIRSPDPSPDSANSTATDTAIVGITPSIPPHVISAVTYSLVFIGAVLLSLERGNP